MLDYFKIADLIGKATLNGGKYTEEYSVYEYSCRIEPHNIVIDELIDGKGDYHLRTNVVLEFSELTQLTHVIKRTTSSSEVVTVVEEGVISDSSIYWHSQSFEESPNSSLKEFNNKH